MSESVEARERELAEKASRALPFILEQLESKKEPVEISGFVATKYEVDDKTAYRWVQITEERFLTRSKRLSVIGLLLLWPGMLAVLAAVVLVVADWNSPLGGGSFTLSALLGIAGGTFALPGIYFTFFARRFLAKRADSLF